MKSMATPRKKGPHEKTGAKQKLPFEQKTLEEIESMAYRGMLQRHVADYFGISESTWYAKIKEHPEFLQAYKRGTSKGVRRATTKLLEAVERGERWAVQFYLKYRGSFVDELNLNLKASDSAVPIALQLTSMDPVEASRMYQKIMAE